MRSDVFEKNVALPGNRWAANYQPVFTFNISDTAATYAMYLTMRHTDAYPFSNIWISKQTTLPDGKKDSSIKIEVPLAQPDGKWLGRGMNEIWEHRMPLNRDGEPIRFKHAGQYSIQIQQLMRTNPLPEVLSVGIRLEKNH